MPAFCNTNGKDFDEPGGFAAVIIGAMLISPLMDPMPGAIEGVRVLKDVGYFLDGIKRENWKMKIKVALKIEFSLTCDYIMRVPCVERAFLCNVKGGSRTHHNRIWEIRKKS